MHGNVLINLTFKKGADAQQRTGSFYSLTQGHFLSPNYFCLDHTSILCWVNSITICLLFATLTLSSGLSNTFSIASVAGEELKEEYPDRKIIKIIDKL